MSTECPLLLSHSDELIDMYKAFTKDFPVISIEDPFDQDDIEHSKKLTAEGVCQVPKPLMTVTSTKADTVEKLVMHQRVVRLVRSEWDKDTAV